ncbi:MAG: sensor histidine kinase, partial [Planctomycetota bacterium]
PRIRPESERGRDDAVRRIRGLPDYVATARISEEARAARAAGRERIYWYIIAFSVAGILAGGCLTARVVMREIKLAKLKSGFVSNITHELKTPLTSIRMFTEMLREGKVMGDAERDQCLTIIAQESTRLSHLIQRVLDFGKLEARRRTYRWTTRSVAGLVVREAERFQRTTDLSADRLELRIEGQVPPVQHDPEALAEVLSNLLSNAYKYSSPEDRRIGVSLRAARGRVLLCVEDNGPGVAAGERKRIFEQFYRSHDLLTNEVEGTGLGLTIARNLVRAHGGNIRVEDRPGGGSRFVVDLPAAAGGAARPQPAGSVR